MQRLLDHVGLRRPFRFERAVPVLLALLSAVVVALIAARFVASGVLPLDSPRGAYFAYLFALIALVIVLARWPRLAVTVLVLMLVELTWGLGTYALNRVGIQNGVVAAARRGRAAPFPMASAAAGSADPLAQHDEPEGGQDQPFLARHARPRSQAGRARRAQRRGHCRRLDNLRYRRQRRRYVVRSPGGRARGSLLRRQSRRARLHHGRAPDRRRRSTRASLARRRAARSTMSAGTTCATLTSPTSIPPMPISICRARSTACWSGDGTTRTSPSRRWRAC